MILDILTHTPIWVFVLFAVIVALGACRLRDGERDARRVCVIPVLFIVAGLIGVCLRDDAVAISAWLIAVAVGLLLGSLSRPAMRSVAGCHRIFLAGSAWPLTRVVMIFVAHYFLNVAAVLSFDHRVDFIRFDAAVSGMAAGFFAGWLWRFVQAYHVVKATPTLGVADNLIEQ